MLVEVRRRRRQQKRRQFSSSFMSEELVGTRRFIMILWMVSGRMSMFVRAAFSVSNRGNSQSIRRYPAPWFVCNANNNNNAADDEDLNYSNGPGYNNGDLESLFGDPDDDDDDNNNNNDYDWMKSPKEEGLFYTDNKSSLPLSNHNEHSSSNNSKTDWNNKTLMKNQYEKNRNPKSVHTDGRRMDKNDMDGVSSRKDDYYKEPTSKSVDPPVVKRTSIDIPKDSRRRRPPPVMEYDFSHYDDEFGDARPGEFGAATYIPEEVSQNTIQDNVQPTMSDGPSNKMDHNGHNQDDDANNYESIHFENHNSIKTEKTTSAVIQESSAQIQEKPYQNDNSNINIQSAQSSLKASLNERNDNDDASLHSGRLEAIVPSDRLAFQKIAASGIIPSSGYDVTKKNTKQMRTFSTYSNKEAIQLELQELEEDLQRLKEQLFGLNKNKKFNVNSPKQVSVALFGVDDVSTNKEALEALAATATNPANYNKAKMAELIIQTRQLSRQIKKLQLQTTNSPSSRTNNSHNSFYSTDKMNDSVTSNDDNSRPEFKRDNPLLLLDASAFIFRAYYSMPPLHAADGTPVGAVLGFCNMINRLILNSLCNGETPHMVLVLDSQTGSQTRKEIYKDYKANRKPCPEDLIPQFDLIQKAATAYGISQLECPNMEADDVIATLSTIAAYQEGCHVNILSGDKDLMQLITPPRHDNHEIGSIHMIDPMTSARYTHQDVMDKWGVPPDRLGDLLALAGDSSDNIPGVPGIGPKIAAQLLQQYGTLDQLLESLDDIRQTKRRQTLQENKHLAQLSRKLVELVRDIPLQSMNIIASTPSIERVSDIYVEPLNVDRLVAFYDEMGFRELKQKLLSRLSTQKAVQIKKTSKVITENNKHENLVVDKKNTKEMKSNNNMNDTTSFMEKLKGNALLNTKKEKPPPSSDFDEIPF